ncbi:hypothetical protein C3463_21330 [Serratia marcescens]|nr:hypothetical protein C3463_21330 [Serratia marcescens]
MKIDTKTPEGRKALRLMTVPVSALIAALGLPERYARPDNAYYSRAELCVMAASAGLSPRDFL